VSVASVLLIAFGSISTAFAQGASGLVDGQFVDSSGSGIAGVSVTLSDSSSGFTRTTTSNAGGNFKIQVPPGEYVLKSSKDGYSSVTIDQVMVNLGVTTDLTIPVQDDTIEVITTYGTATELMPASTGETGLNISLDEVSQMPVARNIEAVALLAPSTTAGDTAFGEEKTLVSFGGASVAENVYYINGLNVTNFRNGLGGASVPFEFYDQFQIKSGGYSAEFGRSLGGVLNAVTKTGDNDFHYGIVSYFEPSAGRSENPDTLNLFGEYYDLNGENERSGFTTDVYVSGPIIKDRLFFYALYEQRNDTEEFNSRGAPETFNDREIDNGFWGGNLLWNITDSHSLSYTTFTDERERVNTQSDYDVDARSKGPETGIATEFRGGTNHIVRYDGQFGDNFRLSAMWGENNYDLTSTSTTDQLCPYVVDTSSGALPGNTSLFPGCEASARIDLGGDTREAYRLDLEWYVGDHTIRIGYDDETNTSESASTYSGTNFRTDGGLGVYYRYYTYSVDETLPNGAIVPDVNGDGSDVQSVRYRLSEVGGEFETNSSAWYIEDTWDINDQFTVSAGVRNETFENLNGNGDQFIEVDDQWGPRLAASFSPGGSADSRIFGTWGRYHIPIANNTNVRLSGAELGIQRYFVFDGDFDPVTAAPNSIDAEGVPTTQEYGTVLVTANGVTPDGEQLADKNLEPMYHDELILGFERSLGENWIGGIRYIRRDLKSHIDDILIDDAVDALGYEHTGDAGGYVLSNPGSDVTIPYDRFDTGTLEETVFPADLLGYDKAERTYDALEISLERPFADRWGMTASYTWAKNEGNTEGYVKSDNGQDDAGITQDFDQPQLMDGAFGYLPNDRRHTIKAFGSFQVNDRLLIGANTFIQSGRPINSFGIDHPDGLPIYGDTYYVTNPNTGELNFIPRGTAGRTDWVVRFDLSAIYSFNWGDRADVELRAEVFNLLDGDSVTEVYEFAELSIGETDPRLHAATAYQTPRYFRLGATFRF
jgi:outer membrane receptor protein involved in Fe transport